MGFRDPITTIAAVDTRGANPAGVRIYEATNPDGTGTTKGVVEWDDGAAGDLPAQALQTVAPTSGPRSVTDPFGRLTIKGGSYRAGGSVVAAPDFTLGVEQDSAGNPVAQARVGGLQLATVGGDWTSDVNNTSYLWAMATGAWTTLPNHSVSVIVPAGRVLEVEWKTSRIYVLGNVWSVLRLQINGTTADASDFSPASTASSPIKLTGSYANTTGVAASVPVVVQGQAGGAGNYVGPGGGAIGASGAGGAVILRRRIR